MALDFDVGAKSYGRFKIAARATLDSFPAMNLIRNFNFWTTKSSDFWWKLSTQPIQHIYIKIKSIGPQKFAPRGAAMDRADLAPSSILFPLSFLSTFQLIITSLTTNST